MSKRKPPSEFALRRGELMRRARLTAEWSQDLVAKKLGLKSREVVSQYESGKIEEISEKTCRAIVFHLGLLPSDVAEDPSVFQFSEELPTMSAEARSVARRWDSYPDHVREFVKKTLDGYDEAAAAPPPKKRPTKKKP